MAFFGIVISAVLARFMTKTAFGQFSYYIAVSQLFLPILDMGASGYYTKRSARNRDMIGLNWARSVGLKLYSIPITIVALAAYFYFAKGRIDATILLVIIYAITYSFLLSTDGPFRSGEMGFAWAIRRTVYEVSYFVMTLGTLILFHLTTPLQQFMIAIAAVIIAAAWAITTVVNVTGLNWRQFREQVFTPLGKAELTALWPFAVNGFLFVFYYRLTAIFIDYFGKPAELADFRVAFVIMTAVLYVPRSISWASNPRMQLHEEKNDIEKFHRLLRNSADINLIITALTTIGGLIYGSTLIGLLFGHKYANLGWMWYVIDLSMGLFLVQQFCVVLLNSFRKERHVVRTFVMGIAVLTMLNIILIPRMGALGAAWARLAAGLLMVPLNLRALAQLVGWSNLHGMNLWRFTAANLAAAAVGVAVLFVNFWLSLACFLIAYAGLLYVLGTYPEPVERMIKRILRRLHFRTQN